jgi:hypothetical protein
MAPCYRDIENCGVSHLLQRIITEQHNLKLNLIPIPLKVRMQERVKQ